VALGLALLDQKRVDEARLELERILGARAGAGLAAGGVAQRDDPDAEPAWPVEADPEVEPPASFEGGSTGPEAPASPGTEAPQPPASVFGEDGVGESELEAAFEEAQTDRDQVVDADDVARAALDALPEEEDDDTSVAFDTDGEGIPFDAEAEPIALEDETADVRDDHVDEDVALEVRDDHVDEDVALEVRDDHVDEDAALEVPDDHAEGDAFVAALAEDADSPFATETVADLLERQGRGPEAERIRARLSAPEAPAPPSPEPQGSPEPEPDRQRRATLERWLTNIRRHTR
jgi:hypothetical protein